MNSTPLVTVMIPTYNQADVLPKAIDSALFQNYENIEIIVCNDNSTDHTPDVLKQYAENPKIKIHHNQKNIGRVGNYKHMLEDLATGEWVINLDGDDYFTDNNFIAAAMAIINSERENDIVFLQGGHTVTSPDGKPLYQVLPNITSDYEVIAGTNYFLQFHHFSHLASIFKRTTAKELDFYRYDILSSDIESFLRLAMHGKVILFKRIAGAWVHHGLNESKKLSIDIVEKNMLRFNAPATYATSLKKIPPRKIAAWKRSKLYGYLLQYLIIYFRDPDKLPGYLKHTWKKYASPVLLLLVPYAFLKAKL